MQIVTIFLATILLTVVEVLDSYVTVVKIDKSRAVFWGFFSWVLAGLIIVNISGTPLVKFLSVLSAGLGAGCGNLIGIKIIQFIKKQKKTKRTFISTLKTQFKKTVLYKSSRKLLGRPKNKRQMSQTVQPILSFFRQ